MAFDPDWIPTSWPGNPRVVGLFTTRSGGVSRSPYDDGRGGGGLNLASHVGDHADAVAANRALLQRQTGVPAVYLEQVHGVAVADLDRPDHPLRADAALTSRAGLAACVMVADCLPLLLAAPDGRGVAAAHAGWRGLAGGVVEASVLALCERAGCTPRQLQAWIGPSIGPLQFEVGAEVRAAFVAATAQSGACFVAAADGKWLADLAGLARLRLQLAGVDAQSIFGGGWCTVSNPRRFWSYRRDRVCGRQAGLIWLQHQPA